MGFQWGSAENLRALALMRREARVAPRIMPLFTRVAARNLVVPSETVCAQVGYPKIWQRWVPRSSIRGIAIAP